MYESLIAPVQPSMNTCQVYVLPHARKITAVSRLASIHVRLKLKTQSKWISLCEGNYESTFSVLKFNDKERKKKLKMKNDLPCKLKTGDGGWGEARTETEKSKTLRQEQNGRSSQETIQEALDSCGEINK